MLKNIEKSFGKFFKNLKSKGNNFIKTQASSEFILQRNNFGVVGAETSAVQKVVARISKEVRGISDSSVFVEKFSEISPLKLHFTLELEQNFSVNDVSKDLVSAVREELEKIFAIIEVEIYVRVTDISQPAKKEKRRVR